MTYTTRVQTVKDGVIDAVLDYETNLYYLKRYWFSEHRSAVSVRNFNTVEEAKAAWERGRLRWEK